MEVAVSHWHLISILVVVFVLIASYRFWLWLCGVVIVPDDAVGIVTKKFVLFGSNRRLPDGRIIALNGEAGFQADTLSPRRPRSSMRNGMWLSPSSMHAPP